MTKELITVETTEEDGSTTEKKIYIQRPSNEISVAADRYRAKIWTQCLRDGVLTKLELGKVLKERGIWDESKDEEHNRIVQ